MDKLKLIYVADGRLTSIDGDAQEIFAELSELFEGEEEYNAYWGFVRRTLRLYEQEGRWLVVRL